MGSGRWSEDHWNTYTTKTRSYATKSTREIFTSHDLKPELDPKGVKFRESRDSEDNPNSTPIIAALDVTGSMHTVLDVVARNGMNTLVKEIYERKPVTDPHILCAAIGDVEAGDRAPLQITQFEADLRIAKQLEQLYLEGGGGGNMYESYALAWYFAAHHTQTDSFTKRGKKGYLFTIGDEKPTPYLREGDIERVFGYRPQARVEMDQLLTAASREWDIFHIIVSEGSNARNMGPKNVKHAWTELLGQRAIMLDDHRKLAEVIVSTIQVVEGEDVGKVVGSWDGSTAMTVRKATEGLVKSGAGELVTL